VLDVTHVPSGKRAFHCPWMLVDSDRSMIAGREVLGFPKKLGAFSFAIDGEELSFRGNETKPFRSPFRAGATVAATVSRGGVTLLDASGALAAPAPKNTKAFSDGTGTERVAFLNAQTNHPIPGFATDRDDDADASPRDSRKDPACVSNRPRLVQFAFDEVPSLDANAAWTIRDASLYLNQTKTDAIAAPFQDTEPEVVSATFSVTNLYTGSEPTPTTGEEVPPGYVENDDVYWLRYQ
jgi:hypothetical protein